MKKFHKVLIGIGAVFILFIVARLFGIIQWYTIPTTGNEPTLKVGCTVWATNLITPKRLNFVSFKCNENGQTEIWIKRLCGLPGETVEIRDGIFYADGKNFDEGLTLYKAYFGIGKSAIDFAKRKNLEPFIDYYENPLSDTIIFNLTEDQVKNEQEIFRKIELVPNPEIEKYWNEGWTTNDFGPVKIPENHVFVLGDNRNDSRDSRFIGFISLENIYGVVLE